MTGTRWLRRTGVYAAVTVCVTLAGGPALAGYPADDPIPSASVPATDLPTPSDLPSPTALPSPTDLLSPTDSPSPTESPSPTDSPSPTESPSPTDSPSPTESPSPTDSPSPTESPSPTDSPTPTGTPTGTPSATDTPPPTDSPPGSPTGTDSGYPSYSPSSNGIAGPVYRGSGHLPPPDGSTSTGPLSVGDAVGPAWNGGLVPSPANDSQAAKAEPTGAVAPVIKELPRLAERALHGLPAVGPVTPTGLKLPLWAMVVVLALGLVWLAAVGVHLAGRRS